MCVIVACAGLLFLFLNRYRFYYNYVNIALQERVNSPVRARVNSSDTEKRSGPAQGDRAPLPADRTRARGTDAPVTRGKIDINRADLVELMSLPGIGRVTALNIIEYRTRAGGFTDVGELEEVKGIGPKKLEAILQYVTVEGGG